MKPAYLFLVATILLFSCKKFVDGGIPTTISGYISDTSLNLPIANARVMVVEYASSCLICRPRPTGFMDSAFTDAQGNYKLTFTTTGSGSQYRLQFQAPEHHWGWSGAEIRPGKDTVINVAFQKLKWLKAGIKMDSIPSKPLDVSGLTTASVFNFPADTTVYIEVPVNKRIYITFRYEHPDSAYIFFRKFESLETLGLSDSLSAQYTLDASTFTHQ